MSHYYDLKQKIEAEIEEACKPIKSSIWKRYGGELLEAQRRDREHEERWKNDVIKSAKKKALWPIGTKLVEWSNRDPMSRWSHKRIPWYKTGRVGFYEIYDDRCDKVTPSLGHGSLFVRLALKNGEPGRKSAERFGTVWKCWLPEGEHPDTYEHPANKENEGIKV